MVPTRFAPGPRDLADPAYEHSAAWPPFSFSALGTNIPFVGWASQPNPFQERAHMKKLITLTIAAACLAAPAFAGTNDANQTTKLPRVEKNTGSAPQNAVRPATVADKNDDTRKGLSLNTEDCNKGCIGGNPP
jgi:hypothetical protein